VVKALSEIADTHGVAPVTVALAWLRTRPNVAAPIASARTVEQLPALLASATLDLSLDELTTLDNVSAHLPE
jgi:aryl-alcohol dehydrogenase-like predicted oxidoreductase